MIDFLRLPEFARVSGATGYERFFFETPDAIDPRDPATRLGLIRTAMRAFLRRQEFLGFEPYVERLSADLQPSRVPHAPEGVTSSPARFIERTSPPAAPGRGSVDRRTP